MNLIPTHDRTLALCKNLKAIKFADRKKDDYESGVPRFIKICLILSRRNTLAGKELEFLCQFQNNTVMPIKIFLLRSEPFLMPQAEIREILWPETIHSSDRRFQTLQSKPGSARKPTYPRLEKSTNTRSVKSSCLLLC